MNLKEGNKKAYRRYTSLLLGDLQRQYTPILVCLLILLDIFTFKCDVIQVPRLHTCVCSAFERA